MAKGDSNIPLNSRKNKRIFRLTKSSQTQEAKTAIMFIFPALILLIIFWIYPMFNAFYLSMQEYNMISSIKKFIGTQNYMNLIQDEAYKESLLHSLYFTVVVIPVQTAISLGLALLVKKVIPGIGLFRSVYF